MTRVIFLCWGVCTHRRIGLTGVHHPRLVPLKKTVKLSDDGEVIGEGEIGDDAGLLLGNDSRGGDITTPEEVSGY